MIPNWADNSVELSDFIREAHAEHVGMPRTGSAGAGVHIGIIDSAYQLPDAQTNGYDVRGGIDHSFISTSESDTTGHCSRVFHRLAWYSPDATFSLYQAVTEDETLTTTGLSEAITAAINDGVDILNLSAGRPWRGPVSANPAVQQVQRALAAGITVVAAAGQWYPDQQDEKPPVYCPAAYDDVVAVGGLETTCPGTPGDEPADEQKGPYYAIPPADSNISAQTPTEAFCGANGCSEGGGCITNQQDREWEYNPLPTNNKPDVLAPMHVLLTSDDRHDYFELLTGSSFAAPIVTASLANIFSELRDQGQEIPHPQRVRELVQLTGTEIAERQLKYNAWALRKELGII